MSFAAPTGLGSETFNPHFVDATPEPAPVPDPEPVAAPAPAPQPAPAPAAPKSAPAPRRVTTKARPAADAPTKAPAAPAAKPVPVTAPVSTAAPAAPTEPAPAETTPEQASATATAAPTPDQLAARRRRLKYVGWAVLAAAVWLWWTKPWVDIAATNQTAAGTGLVQVSADATDIIGADMAKAETYLATNGTLDGIILDGAQVAVRGTTMYAVRTIDGVCTVYGLLEGQRLTPTPDPTNAACTGQIVSVQAQLDEAAHTAENTSTYAAEETLRKAADAAAAYAGRNFVDGQPSMTGLPGSLSGALVMNNEGDYVTLRVSYPDACVETFVTAAGEIGETNSCS